MPATTLTDAGLSRPSPPPADAKKPAPTWAWVVGIGVLGIFVIGLFAGNSPESKAKQQAEAVIQLCWQDQARKSVPPDTARIMAQMCERLENEHQQKLRSGAYRSPATVTPPASTR